MLNIAVFVSGRGSNLRAISQSINDGALDARIKLVVSSRDAASALSWADDQGIPNISVQSIPAEKLASTLLSLLEEHGVDFIALAGFLKLIPAEVVQSYRHRILNVHPALLPSFGGPGMYGHHVHDAVIGSGAKVSGATVHLVDEEYDRGPIVMQRSVTIMDADTPESLAERVLEIEHSILPEALQLFALGRVTVNGRRAIINS